jgi:hypothetical protein
MLRTSFGFMVMEHENQETSVHTNTKNSIGMIVYQSQYSVLITSTSSKVQVPGTVVRNCNLCTVDFELDLRT